MQNFDNHDKLDGVVEADEKFLKKAKREQEM